MQKRVLKHTHTPTPTHTYIYIHTHFVYNALYINPQAQETHSSASISSGLWYVNPVCMILVFYCGLYLA